MKEPGKKLKEISKIRTGGVLTRIKSSSPDSNGVVYDLITLKSIDERGRLDRSLTEGFRAEVSVNPEFITRRGDVLVRLREPVTAIHIDSKLEGLLVSSLFAIIRCSGDGVDTRYIYHFINSESARKQLTGYVKGSTIRMVKTSALGELEVELPSFEKQGRISDLMDLQMKEIELIEELKNKKEVLLKEYGRRLFR